MNWWLLSLLFSDFFLMEVYLNFEMSNRIKTEIVVFVSHAFQTRGIVFCSLFIKSLDNSKPKWEQLHKRWEISELCVLWREEWGWDRLRSCLCTLWKSFWTEFVFQFSKCMKCLVKFKGIRIKFNNRLFVFMQISIVFCV